MAHNAWQMNHVVQFHPRQRGSWRRGYLLIYMAINSTSPLWHSRFEIKPTERPKEKHMQSYYTNRGDGS